jgi:DegV family protein with EDD domain
MAKAGKSAEEIISELNRISPCMNTSFVIDTLDYLHKGGRCSLAKLIASKLLNLKPVIEVHDNAMRVGAKYTGKFAPTVEKYITERLEPLAKADNIDLSRIYITVSTCPTEVIEFARETIKKYAGFTDENIIITYAGCTVANHCGPNTLGIIFKQKSEIQI